MRNSTIDPDSWKFVASYDTGLSAKMLALLGRRLSEALKLFVVSFAQVLSERAQHEERLRLALAGFRTPEEEREAQIADAYARAEKLKPKLTPAQATHPLNVPEGLTPEERAQYVREMIDHAKTRMEATA